MQKIKYDTSHSNLRKQIPNEQRPRWLIAFDLFTVNCMTGLINISYFIHETSSGPVRYTFRSYLPVGRFPMQINQKLLISTCDKCCLFEVLKKWWRKLCRCDVVTAWRRGGVAATPSFIVQLLHEVCVKVKSERRRRRRREERCGRSTYSE